MQVPWSNTARKCLFRELLDSKEILDGTLENQIETFFQATCSADRLEVLLGLLESNERKFPALLKLMVDFRRFQTLLVAKE